MDARTQIAVGGDYPSHTAMEFIDRPDDAGRQGQEFPQCLNERLVSRGYEDARQQPGDHARAVRVQAVPEKQATGHGTDTSLDPKEGFSLSH